MKMFEDNFVDDTVDITTAEYTGGLMTDLSRFQNSLNVLRETVVNSTIQIKLLEFTLKKMNDLNDKKI